VSTNKAVLAIVVGVTFIVLGLTMKQFYAAKGIYGGGSLGRPIARWQGRLLFLVIGIVFCSIGIAYFFTDH
jgi:hypothetical protein